MIELNESRLLKKREIADYLGFTIWAIDAWVSQHRIPFVKFGKAVRFDLNDIENWIQEHKEGPCIFSSSSKKKQ